MSKEKKNKKVKKTLIGGQAVIEGVMMRGATAMATSVRDEDGVIRVETKRLKPLKERCVLSRIPFLRGVYNLIESLVSGTNTLMRSAEVFGEGEPGRFEKWCEKKLHVNLMSVITTLSTILGVALAIGLFIFAPIYLTKLLMLATGELHPIAVDFIEGGIKILIFIAYLLLVSLMKDIKRTFMYHGAEHKTIACYEKGLELTPENAKKCSRLHDRCGTTFIFLVLFISIIVFVCAEAVFNACGINFNEDFGKIGRLYKALVKLALLPFVAGISYEVLRLLAKSSSPLLLPIKAPGLLLQKITTREPTDDMLEVAINSFNTVLAMDADQSIPEVKFVVPEKVAVKLQKVKDELNKAGIDEDAEAEWIVSIVTGIKRSELHKDKNVSPKQLTEIDEIVKERVTGRPLWYCIGDTDFYGYKIKVDERVLIPRPETEELVEHALPFINETKKVLDLCTGSGAIAIAIKKRTNATVTASDISADALTLAKENAELNGAEINFVESDLFENLNGEKFDVIVTNPPYIPLVEKDEIQREVRDFEPSVALYGGNDGMDFYRKIAISCGEYLAEHGIIIMECGDKECESVEETFKENGFETAVIEDIKGIKRMVKAVKNV